MSSGASAYGLERSAEAAEATTAAPAESGSGPSLEATMQLTPPSVDRRGFNSIAFVIPALDEEENLPRLLADMSARIDLIRSEDVVFIVDDGSTDGTAGIADTYSGPLDVRLISLGTNQGPGTAFRVGFKRALECVDDDSVVVTLEADTTSDLDVLAEMLRRVDGGADLVLASVHGGGRLVNVPAHRRVLSRAAGGVVRAALGTDARTVSSFFRVYRASLLRRGFDRYGTDLIREPGFACKAELLVKLSSLGAHVEEIPVELDGSRRIGASKMPLFGTLVGYWRLVVRARVRREYASS